MKGESFGDGENMFYFLVKDALNAFDELSDSNVEQMETEDAYNPFADDWATFWVDFIFEHYDGIKLLICCSKGSAYESFEEDLIEKEASANKRYAEIMKFFGKKTKKISDFQWHILSTSYVHLVFEIVRHDMSKKDALEHMKFVSSLLYPGWKEIFGIQ